MFDLVVVLAQFDPFTLLGPLLTGGLNLAGSAMQNSQNAATNAQNQLFNSGEAIQQRNFAAAQGDITRQFAAVEADKAFNRNADEAQKARDFIADQANTSRNFNYNESGLARQFAERMSSSAYQRATADMKAAGINPMVAYSQGGASTPSAPMASSSPVSGPAGSGPAATAGNVSGSSASVSSVPFMQNMFQGALSTALEYAKGHPMIENMKQDFKTKEWETEATRAEARRRIIEGDRLDDDRNRIKAETKLKEYEASKAKRDSEFYESKPGNWSRWIGNIGREALPALNSAETLRDTLTPGRR